MDFTLINRDARSISITSHIISRINATTLTICP
jgi:hypothetical protein